MAKQKDEFEVWIAKTVGANVRRLREGGGYHIEELAKCLGVAVRTAQSYEKGDRRLSIASLIKLASAFGVNVERLIDEQAEKRPQLKVITLSEYKKKAAS